MSPRRSPTSRLRSLPWRACTPAPGFRSASALRPTTASCARSCSSSLSCSYGRGRDIFGADRLRYYSGVTRVAASMRPLFLFYRAATFCAAAALAAPAIAADSGSTAKARQLWSHSPHGRMLERILPPAVGPGDLPEPHSEGARLTARYCVQCHHLPNPQMHTREKWAGIVERMVWRMQGKGNMGALMKDMMAGIQAPTPEEVAVLNRYLQQHSQQAIDPAHPGLKTEAGKMFSIACSQCHAAPDPRQHT